MAKQVSITQTLQEMVSDATSEFYCLQSEVEEWKDHLPDNLQNSTKADLLDQAATDLSDISEIGIPEYLQNIPITYLPVKQKRNKSRAVRCSEAAGLLRTAAEHLSMMIEQIEELRSDLEEAADGAEQIEFPGMYS